MLVLTRKLQQQITVGDNITITILRVSGKSVRVGIDAPREVRVVRSELPERPTTSSTPRVPSKRGTSRRAPLAERIATRGASHAHGRPDASNSPTPSPLSTRSIQDPAGHLRGTTPAASPASMNPSPERLGAIAMRTFNW